MDTFLEQLSATTWVEWLGMVTGIVGVWLSIKEKIAAWPLFIICYTSYVYISYLFGLHAFMGMNIVFIGISIYGWIKWATHKEGEDADLVVSRTSAKHWPVVAAFIVLGTGGIGWLLSTTGEANKPFLDAFATCCGFTAQWMLSRKHIETWFFWIMTDVIYVGLFAAGASWPSVVLFASFILLAIKGLREWRGQLKAT